MTEDVRVRQLRGQLQQTSLLLIDALGAAHVEGWQMVLRLAPAP